MQNRVFPGEFDYPVAPRTLPIRLRAGASVDDWSCSRPAVARGNWAMAPGRNAPRRRLDQSRLAVRRDGMARKMFGRKLARNELQTFALEKKLLFLATDCFTRGNKRRSPDTPMNSLSVLRRRIAHDDESPPREALLQDALDAAARLR